MLPGGSAQSFPSLLGDVVTAWNPNTAALADGNGDGVQITAAQSQAMTAFIDALKAAASPALRVTIDRELALLDPPSFVGVTMTEAIARLDRLSCPRQSTFPSVKCRVDELGTLITRLVAAGPLPTKLGKAVVRCRTCVAVAEQASGRPARRSLGKAIRLVRKLDKRVRSRRGVKAATEDARAVLLDGTTTLRADLEVLRTAAQ